MNSQEERKTGKGEQGVPEYATKQSLQSNQIIKPSCLSTFL